MQGGIVTRPRLDAEGCLVLLLMLGSYAGVGLILLAIVGRL
jgi:hypothetical protein